MASYTFANYCQICGLAPLSKMFYIYSAKGALTLCEKCYKIEWDKLHP